ncbi:Nucleotide-binding universal stress protein, UspA family [Desulfatibacillum alkenivorans DSM 16219]|uniref:Nucleotide-binding universal stress protein, UspA family n=1 Tax=Desulfatibacillum alkenivorans DSM 16219 TaxID=1121393 RepID=A0A1M6DV99_9BACT|nr:universal stress protein [Desulfatibacillum alkenivorans]SHI77174.1 Nucleotide-binding universal stress protein, UspA family [Desulfatibacillum alkenivorans DSM 16219]
MKILVGYERSRESKNVMDIAIKHAKAWDGKIFLATSLFGGVEMEKDELEKAEKILKEAKETLDAEGIECETHVLVRGLEPGEDLVNFAKEKEVDEIIIGVKSKSKVGKLLFGSNAQFVILNAPCPVMTVKK